MLAAAMLASPAGATDTIPLPRPRPKGIDLRLPPGEGPVRAPPAATAPAEGQPAAEPEVPALSECRLRLTAELAVIEPLPPLVGPGQCGADDVVQLDAIITKDNGRVVITPPATLRCPMAEAVVNWVRDEVAPAAVEFGAPLRGIANFASYECRGRNRIVGALLSQHGLANALDVRALLLGNGKAVELTDPAVKKNVRERLKQASCARFTTVLGPGSDGYHENHIHLDLAERRSGYRICQWAVRDPADLAPPLPRERPPEAPPREEGAAVAPNRQ